ncbi:hypothetical protein [Aeromonas caviae]|uniref:hypothetical protein n=1 Tax=Aeromonas caviae TaxID=648 RepID=UPI003F746869
MDKSTQLMKWILFWVFIVLFALAVLGTLGVVFLGFGTPTEAEREWLVKGLLLEVTACIIALFYSIFGLKPESGKQNINLEDIEMRLTELESKIFLTAKEINSNITESVSRNEDYSSSPRKDFMHQMYPFLARIDEYDTPPPFDVNKYNISPSYTDIDADISSAKPFDKEHRRNSYYGLKVQWKCAYKGITEKEDCYIIRLDTERPLFGAYINISKEKDISKLKILDEGHPMWICGEITDLSGSNVELGNADFYI